MFNGLCTNSLRVGFSVSRTGLLFYARNGVDTIGLSTISGTWPNCTVQAIPGGPLEDFGPFANSAIVDFSSLPQIIDDRFFWGVRGYAFYQSEQLSSAILRILRYLASTIEIAPLYVNGEILIVNGDPLYVEV